MTSREHELLARATFDACHTQRERDSVSSMQEIARDYERNIEALRNGTKIVTRLLLIDGKPAREFEPCKCQVTQPAA